MVVSFIDGRLRVRDEALKIPIMAYKLKDKLMTINGVIDVSVSYKVGSLLIIYNAPALNIDMLMEVIAPYVSTKDNYKSVTKNSSIQPLLINRHVINTGMILSLTVNIVSALSGMKSLHISSGIAFLMFCLNHIYKHRRLLFA
ncbi:MAG: hypothetical protein L3V56_04000 [Candidatus Magnetoovum sp. WYHC-5]|nr:hypothetical protein [Candidatus Magnetoovum sp. WYHC-5]